MQVLVRMILAAALLTASGAVEAQTITGTITGIVKDASGGVLPGATITMTQVETDRQETAVSDPEGRYTSPAAAARELSHRGQPVRVQERRPIRGDADDRRGRARGLHARSRQPAGGGGGRRRTRRWSMRNTSSVGKLVDNRRIAELPLNTRNVYSLIFLTPGVAGTIGNAYGDLRYTINGARPRSSDTLVDGVTATFPTVTGGAGISVFPSVDAIQEFKVLGATYPAEFGRSLGSVINVVYKSGSNDFHGSAYEFLRDSAFDSRNYFQKLRGEELGDFSRHQFGGAAGGPMQTGKMFYMVSFEGLREKAFSSRTLDGADRARTPG